MIDPHVHCRDEGWAYKETIAHALSVAKRAGLDGIFDMPNNQPITTTREAVLRRLDLADKVNSSVFYGLYVGVTADPQQLEEAVRVHHEFFPRVVGLKMFAGHSVGNLAVIEEEQQRLVYRTLAELGYQGVLVVHCEKEAFLHPELWNPQKISSHSLARPPEAETRSVIDQIKFSKVGGFKGHLHIAHVSVPASVLIIDDEAERGNSHLSCGITPHHCLLGYDIVPFREENPLIYKVNPSLRETAMAGRMSEFLQKGMIDWIETDHAPHLIKEKTDAPYLSGFPGLAFYPHFINYLRLTGFSNDQISSLTHTNIERVFGFKIPTRGVTPDYSLHQEYEVDVYLKSRELVAREEKRLRG
ncbi:MAG: dihydroorotase [Candidatus Woesearchaeota archaeon]